MNAAQHNTNERKILKLLKQSQQRLASAIKSFDGKKPNFLEEKYLWCMAVAVNQAAEGFIILKKFTPSGFEADVATGNRSHDMR